MKRILLLVFIFTSTLFSKEFTLDLDKAINMALENNALNRISKLNLDVARAQYEQALSANYPSIDAILYANRAKEDGIFQQRGTFTLPSEFTKTLALADTLSISDPTTRAAAQDTISATPH